MSTFLSANPIMTSAVAQNMDIALATIGDLTVSGTITGNITTGNLTNLSIADMVTANIEITDNLFVTTDSFFAGNALLTGQLRVLGTSVASLFSGNGSGLTGITDAALPGVITSDILGNITGAVANAETGVFGNVSIADQVTVIGNVVASFYVGNGSQLEGMFTLPEVANLDIVGNVTGTTADVGTGTFGNVNVSGQVTTIGNVSAAFFIGNGSQLSGIGFTLPEVANLDIVGNVTGKTVNVGNGTFGNVTVLGQVNVTGNVSVSGSIRGTSANVTIVNFRNVSVSDTVTVARNVVAYNFLGNIRGATAVVGRGTFGNVSISGQVTTTGNVSASFFIGNGSQLTAVNAMSLAANIGKITGQYCVAMNGNDSTADGSENKPFLTIQAAHDRALAELPPVNGSISNQAQILIYPGAYGGTANITRFNTVLRGTGSLYARGHMTSIGGINVNCSTSSFVYNNTVNIENLFINKGVTNTGTGSYTLNIDSCYLYGSSSSEVLTMTNPNSLLFINASILGSASTNVTYINANTGIVNIMDTRIQASTGLQSGYLINVGGNCGLTMERCYIDAVNSNNAALFVSGSQTPAVNPFKVTLTNSFVQNTLGHGIDFGTTNALGFFVRNTFQVASGRNVFAGNGIAYQNSQLCTPSFSNTKAATFTLLPIPSF
jgi:hypothetical protein